MNYIKPVLLYITLAIAATVAMVVPPNKASSEGTAPRIIVNSNANTERELSIRELIDIFTRRKTQWDDRTEIVVLTQGMDSLPNKQFLIEVLGITPYQYRSRLGRNTYSGRVAPPIEVDSEEEMLERLVSNDSAIGYIYNYILYKDDERLVIINVTE